MTHHQLALPYDVITPDFISMHPSESLTNYAKRFGQYLVNAKIVDLKRPLFVGGYSFGSAIAQELALDLPARGVLIIGGLLHYSDIKPFIRFFGHYISGWLPAWVYRASEPFVPVVMRLVSGIPHDDIKLARVMYHELPSNLFRRGYQALARWRGCDLQLPMLRMHGEHDQIILCPESTKDVIVIKDKKHLIGHAAPQIVNDEIEKFIESVMSKSTQDASK